MALLFFYLDGLDFNAGGTLNASDKAAIIITNTTVASIVAMMVGTVIAYYYDGHHFHLLNL